MDNKNEQQHNISTKSILLDNIRKDESLQVAFFISLWFICGVIGMLIAKGIEMHIGLDFKTLFEAFKKGEYLQYVNWLKIVSICTHLLQYAIPSLLFVFLLYPKKTISYLCLDKPPTLNHILYSIALIVTIYPFISFVYYWNTALLPDSSISKDTLEIQRVFLDMKTPWDFVLNIILLGFVAGIGEELLFRGILQRIITTKTKNIHLAAIITGFVFSLMHFQLEGFLPRFILGVLFCYILIITGNLWITMLIHLLFNSVQVIIPYFYPQTATNINEIQQISPLYAGSSLLVFIIIMFIFIKNNSSNKYIYINKIINN